MTKKVSADQAGWRGAQAESLERDFKAAREEHRKHPGEASKANRNRTSKQGDPNDRKDPQ